MAVIVNLATIGYLQCLEAHGSRQPNGFEAFVQTIRDLLPLGNRRFLLELAERPKPEELLRNVFLVVCKPEDRELIKREAEAAYRVGTPPVQPGLLQILSQVN